MKYVEIIVMLVIIILLIFGIMDEINRINTDRHNMELYIIEQQERQKDIEDELLRIKEEGSYGFGITVQ